MKIIADGISNYLLKNQIEHLRARQTKENLVYIKLI